MVTVPAPEVIADLVPVDASRLPATYPLAVEDRKEAGAVITVNLTMDEAQAVAGALRQLVERSELNELVLGPIDWDDLRTANDKLTKAVSSQD